MPTEHLFDRESPAQDKRQIGPRPEIPLSGPGDPFRPSVHRDGTACNPTGRVLLRGPSRQGRRRRRGGKHLASVKQRSLSASRSVQLAMAMALLAFPRQGSAQGPIQALEQGSADVLVQVVQQGINALPPVASQAYYFEYDDTLGAVTRTERVGSTSFREARTFGQGKFGFRFAGSYFSVRDSIAAPYKQRGFDAFSAFGTALSAKVGLLSFAASYGLLDNVDIVVGLPVTIVGASQDILLPVNPPVVGATVPTLAQAQTLAESGSVQSAAGTVRLQPFEASGFNNGTHVGLGRVSIAANFADRWESFGFAVLPEVLLPSPSSAEFAGPDSLALALNLVGEYWAADWMSMLVNFTYDWDTRSTSLTRFAYAAGVVFPTDVLTADFGVSGSVYQNGITWGPTVIPDAVDTARDFQIVNAEDLVLDTSFVELKLGVKVPIQESYAVAGSVVVPIDNASFRPDALGTLAFEAYF